MHMYMYCMVCTCMMDMTLANWRKFHYKILCIIYGISISCNYRRFETSYSLLHILLGPPTDTPTSEALLPVIKLWPNLIAAACELTGEQRIKVVGILLQLLQWSSSANKLQSVEGGASAAGGSSSVQKLDLAMLKPLWSLYSAMSKEYG